MSPFPAPAFNVVISCKRGKKSLTRSPSHLYWGLCGPGADFGGGLIIGEPSAKVLVGSPLMNRCIRTALLVAGLAALLNQTVLAASISNSLWLRNDSYVENNATLYNVDRAGTVLHSFPNLSMTGVAIDPTTSSIYFSAPRSSGPSSGDFSGIIK